MSIAGSDSGGGAGIQADLRAFAAAGVLGTTALTAVTAQNTLGVDGVHVVPVDVVVQQVESVLADLPVAAVKTGMLATAEVVEAVADLAARGRLPHLVVDPVMVATSGDRLLERRAESLYRTGLLPHADLVTPNLHEAAVLLGVDVGDVTDVADAARELGRLGGGAVVVTGGHPAGRDGGLAALRAVDVLWDGRSVHLLDGPRVPTRNDHGTGCTFSASVAAWLARGAPLLEAVVRARTYLHAAVTSAAGWRLGAGHGPVDHLVTVTAAHRDEVVVTSPAGV
ncbi:bifunctional hydroxymethylpyrimidine kinase/phosphomethylpyrimidine kinase [Thalassiella azotivora]